MTYTVKIEERDFSNPIVANYKVDPVYFSWSCFGGPHIMHLKLTGSLRSLLASLRLLRSPATAYVNTTTPVWWGYVREVTLYFGQLKILVTLDQLFNKVKVQYSFISPDNHMADQSETAWVENLASQTLFGIKELILHRSKIDDDHAENLANTFLENAAFPISEFGQSFIDAEAHALVKCSGWFDTLDWIYYENFTTFYANYGPGPGTFEFADGSDHRMPAQLFTASGNGYLKYAYFQLRKVGSPTRTLYANFRDSAGTLLTSSDHVSPTVLDTDSYKWVKFSFPSPPLLTSGTTYMIGLKTDTADPTHYFAIKTDENQGFSGGYARYYHWGTGTWTNMPSLTAPGRTCDLIFRAVCIQDTGDQINAIATEGDQFFTKIVTPTTGILTAPYRANGYSCLREIQALMHLGTGSRLILAKVDQHRQLEFYEQPDPQTPTVFLGDDCIFYDSYGMPLKPYFPPIGQYAAYRGSTDLMHPFDQTKSPPAFIGQVEYWPDTGGVKIHSQFNQDR